MFYYIHSLLSYCCIIPLDLMHLINRPFIVFWLPHVLYIKYMKQTFKTRNGMWKGTCCVCLSMYRLFHSIFSSSIQLLVNFNFCIRDDFLFFFFHFTYFSLFCMPITVSPPFSPPLPSHWSHLLPSTFTHSFSVSRQRQVSFGLAQSVAQKVEVGLNLPPKAEWGNQAWETGFKTAAKHKR